jgi:hypothetical protein
MTAAPGGNDPARIAEEALTDADKRVAEPEDDGTSAYLDNFAQHTFNR